MLREVIVQVNDTTKTLASYKVKPGHKAPVHIEAHANVNYNLIEKATGYAPENIAIKRVGDDLHIAFEGSDLNAPDIIIDDYYNHLSELVIGKAENGMYYSYVPESAADADAISALNAGDAAGQALGGEGFVTPFWAFGEELGFSAMEALAGVAGFGAIAAAAGGGGGGDDTPTSSGGTISQNDETNTSIVLTGDAEVTEGSSAIYTVGIGDIAMEDMTIDVKISNVTTDGDIVEQTIQVVIPAGDSEVSFTVDNLDDAISENPEEYKVEIVGYTDGGYDSITQTDTVIVSTINDENSPYDPNDPDQQNELDNVTLALSGDASVVEGENANYTLTLVDDAGNPVFTTSNLSVDFTYTYTTAEGEDITESATATISAGSSSVNVTVVTNDDALAEGAEEFQIAINSVTAGGSQFENLTVSSMPVTTTINDQTGSDMLAGPEDTAMISLSGDNSVAEGESAGYTVSVDKVPASDLTVDVTYSYTSASSGDVVTNTTQVTILSG